MVFNNRFQLCGQCLKVHISDLNFNFVNKVSYTILNNEVKLFDYGVKSSES